MAATVVNGPGTPMITRGKPTNVGTLPISTTDAVQFTVSNLVGNPNGFDTLVIFAIGAGSTVTLPVLEVSIDGGNTWASVVAPTNASSSTTFSNAALATGDTVVQSANGYTIAGLQGYGLFRFNASVAGAPAAIWVAIAG